MAFGLSGLSALADRVSGSVKNAAAYKGNKNILEAKVASVVAMAYSDGSCTNEEEQEGIDTLKADRMLQAAEFSETQILVCWQDMVAKRPGSPTGRMMLIREIKEGIDAAKKAGNPQVAEDIVLGTLNVAMAGDDEITYPEILVFKQIESACGVTAEKLMGGPVYNEAEAKTKWEAEKAKKAS